MLTSSPLASTSSSPRTFHYAPNRSTPHSSPRVPAALPRRKSKQNLASQSPAGSLAAVRTPLQQQQQQQQQQRPLPKQYVGVDAATQYSPMEPFDPTVLVQNARLDEHPQNGSPTSTAPLATLSGQPLSAVAGHANKSPHISPKRPEVVRHAVNPLSPAKRRNSQDPTTGAQSTSSVLTQSSASSPKRAKPTEGPPKVLPLKYEFCDVEDMVVLIANMLAELIETNDSLALKSGQLTRFHSRTAPGISVLDYLHRLAKHATLTPALLLAMVYYIDRLCALYPDFTINTLTVHRFLIAAATVAGKGLSDSFWNNSFYARVGGVKVAELKLLELELLYRVDWKIVPNPEVLVAYYKGLVDRCPGYVLEIEPPQESQGPPDGVEGDSDDIDDDDLDDSEQEGGENDENPPQNV